MSMNMNGELCMEDILKNQKTQNPNSVTSLTLSHKALSSVSTLTAFINLERLDLSSNTLTSLKGLESCFNLKWLSVHHNKLLSLKGIEALSNLTVLNAGNNQLTSMDEVKNLVNLCALILNDNEIASISGLDQLSELNTLVLSRNPIRKLASSVAKLKSIVKISLSNCQLEDEDIGNSLKACIGLEQLRLAHNNVKTLPANLANSKKLQILDVGNNMISRWSDLEVLSSLHNLKNLNLHGNPIAEKVKLVKKVKRLVPSLQILNSKRMDKLTSGKDRKIEDTVADVGYELKPLKKKKKDHDVKKWDASEVTKGKPDVAQNHGENERRKKHGEKEVPLQQVGEAMKDKSVKRKVEKAHMDVIDDKETPFAEIVAHDATESMKPNDGQRRNSQAVRTHDANSALVTYPAKKKKRKNQAAGASVLQFTMPDVGLGGPSAWGDDEE